MKTIRSRAVYVFILILLLSSMACGLSTLTDDASPTPVTQGLEVSSTSTSGQPTQIPALARTTETGSSEDFDSSIDLEERLINLYNLVNPSVVHILVYVSEGDTFPLGSGSGFIFDTEGRIVTNNHVVEDGQSFEVIFADGSRRRAEIVGRDIDSDLAVVEVDSVPDGSYPVVLGDSDQLLVGQLVIAIGNPFAEQGSMSLGIVSGLGRSLESQRQPENNTLGSYSLPQVVQTDAPINPGNSGGPLVNLDGEVIGVNSAIRTTTGVNSGVGFSIPVNAVRRIVPTLIERGEYVYSYLGVQIQSLNLSLQDRFNLPQYKGAYVTGVTSGGPADDAGLIPARESDRQGGDLIVAIDGQLVQDTEELIAYLVFNTEVDQTVNLSVVRDGETIIVPLTLGARP
ncbi:MAG: trypsin-like peptidase domain-containing protein [Candidatus Promineifilaceae bacterium]